MPNKKYGIRTIQKQHGGTGKYGLSQYVSMAPGDCFNAGTRSCMSNTRVKIQEAELLYMTYSTAKNKKIIHYKSLYFSSTEVRLHTGQCDFVL
jgi:hypothetical protein